MRCTLRSPCLPFTAVHAAQFVSIHVQASFPIHRQAAPRHTLLQLDAISVADKGIRKGVEDVLKVVCEPMNMNMACLFMRVSVLMTAIHNQGAARRAHDCADWEFMLYCIISSGHPVGVSSTSLPTVTVHNDVMIIVAQVYATPSKGRTSPKTASMNDHVHMVINEIAATMKKGPSRRIVWCSPTSKPSKQVSTLHTRPCDSIKKLSCTM
jgi:hypothetical protein